MKPGRSRRLLTASAIVTVVAIALAPLAAAPAGASNSVVTRIDMTSASAPDPAPVAAAVDEVGDRAYISNTFAGTVSVIDTTTNRLVRTIPHGPTSIGDGPSALAVDPTHRQLYVPNYNSNTVSVVDLTTDTVVDVLDRATSGIGNGPTSVAIDPQLNRAYVSNIRDSTVTVIDTSTNTFLKVLTHGAAEIGKDPIDVAVDIVQHRALVANNADDTVTVIDTRTDTVIAVIPLGPDSTQYVPRQIAVDPTRHRAWVTNEGDGSVSVIDTISNTVVDTISSGVGARPFAIAYDPVGQQIWVDSETQIAAIDAVTLEIVRTIDNRDSSSFGSGIQSIEVDAAKRRAYVTGGASNTVAVLDLDMTAGLSRRSGADRYEGAAAVSASEFAPGVEVAYVASGENFPDALAGSAAAGFRHGPVLLVTTNSVPQSVGAELARLKPKKIIVLGGTAAVGSDVERNLSAYGPVSRLGGADRYAVAAAVSRDAFGSAPPVAYVTSGENFPDALSGGAIAARNGGPTLLVRRDGVPDAIGAELARLKPQRIVVLGGENAVGPAVHAALAAIAPTTRIGGSDRFAVSAAVSAATFTAGAGTAYIASGVAFPDALAGGPVAASNSAPVLLVRPDGIPDAIAAELRRLAPRRIVVLGGPAAVSAGVYEQLRGFLPK